MMTLSRVSKWLMLKRRTDGIAPADTNRYDCCFVIKMHRQLKKQAKKTNNARGGWHLHEDDEHLTK